jgi:cobalt-zinc-cadmium resistance protein CzcA
MGETVSEILDGKRRFNLRVKLDADGSPTDIYYVKNLLIDTDDGRKIPLSQVANVSETDGIEAVNREFGERRIIIQCNVQGRDIGTFVQEAEKSINEKVKLPAGYYIQWGGQFENQQRAMARFLIVVPLSLAIIFVLLTCTFSSVRDAFLVILNVPFAAVGGIAALWIRGMYLSVPSVIGFIALFGVAILNGLVLISTFNKLQSEGYSIKDTIRIGTAKRLRPVLITAMVATLGFLPMAVSTGSGAEVQKPLATVVIGGLITSLLLTLVVLPVLYTFIGNQKLSLQKFVRRTWRQLIKHK